MGHSQALGRSPPPSARSRFSTALTNCAVWNRFGNSGVWRQALGSLRGHIRSRRETFVASSCRAMPSVCAASGSSIRNVQKVALADEPGQVNELREHKIALGASNRPSRADHGCAEGPEPRAQDLGKLPWSLTRTLWRMIACATVSILSARSHR